ncbi:MAG: PQQ-dependent dehydrogenase, methanol/ethanol family [Bryobacterales bacterium]|nr:PQQ-dependent dehydrogenase, methanol/ethanol family [Bryobacterales bacterium]
MRIAVLLFLPCAVGAQTDRGQTLFTRHCVVCHGATAEGGSGPDLTSAVWSRSVTDDQLQTVIRDGVRGTAMPAFGGRIDAAGRAALVAHLRKLSAAAIQPFNSLTAPEIKVSWEDLKNPGAGQWLMYGRDSGNQRFSPLKDIHRGNVRNLVPLWSFQTGTPDGLEATPLFVNGVLFLTTSWNHVFAIDARTGAELWHYKRRLPEKLRYCCGPVNRGVAILNDTLYLGTLDAHLVALNARDGRVKWDVEAGRVEDNLSITSPPLVAGNRIVTGVAGGDYPSRGFIDAYDPATGKRLWRFYTVPAEGEAGAETWSGDSFKTGGAATWMNGSYDPALNLIYWGTGNPYPDYDGDARRESNLYSDCVVALSADTGKLVWHYQFTPHDVWDYDGVNEMVFVDGLLHQGRRVNALVHADRNGHFFALDRAGGKFLYAKPFVKVTWTNGYDDSGRPVTNPAAIPTYEGVEVCPGAAGGKEWNAMSFSPLTRFVYLPVIENCAMFYNYGVEARKKGLPPGPNGFRYLPGKAFGKVMAIRADTGEPAWEVKTRTPMATGMLATAGNLLFTGNAEGSFQAFDAEKGALLWSYQTGSGMRGAPIAFRMDGRQYVAIASGMAGAIGGYTGAGAPWMRNYRPGGTLFVFHLFEPGASTRFHGGAESK